MATEHYLLGDSIAQIVERGSEVLQHVGGQKRLLARSAIENRNLGGASAKPGQKSIVLSRCPRAAAMPQRPLYAAFIPIETEREASPCLRMISSENRFPLFGIMASGLAPDLGQALRPPVVVALADPLQRRDVALGGIDEALQRLLQACCWVDWASIQSRTICCSLRMCCTMPWMPSARLAIAAVEARPPPPSWTMRREPLDGAADLDGGVADLLVGEARSPPVSVIVDSQSSSSV